MKFSAVILAGGKSLRMGRDKAWLEIDGQPLLARQLQLVKEIGASEVFISGRVGVDYSGFDCRVLEDQMVDAGPLGGIATALAEIRSSLLLVLAVDMPRVTGKFLLQLLSRCERQIGTIPKVGGAIEPLAAVYSKAAFGLIEELFTARKEFGPKRQVFSALEKSLSATNFAEKCVEGGLAKFFDVAESERELFENWNYPKDVKGGDKADFIG